MRSKIGNAVRSCFEKSLSLRLPGFHEVADAVVPQGCRVFGLDVSDNFAMYFELVISPKKDSFTVEGAWSRHGRFPGYASLLWPCAFPEANIAKDNAVNGDFRFRLVTLWQRNDDWWKLVPEKSWKEREADDDVFLETGTIPPEPSLEEAMAKVKPMVDDAINKIEQYLLPYFDEVAQQFGYKEKISDLAKIIKVKNDRRNK